MRTYHIPIFVPHLGCPHDCAFCNQKHITGRQTVPTGEDVTFQVKQALATFGAKEYEAEIGFFGGSFTAVDEALQEELLKAAYPFVVDGSVQGIRVSTRPDAISPAILERLKHYGVRCVELGVQSMNEDVLQKSRRGHSARVVYEAASQIKKAGLQLGLQMMTGLPGDTPETAMDTAQKLIDMAPDCVRIYPTLVIRDTALCTWYRRGNYRPETLEEAVALCARLYRMFATAHIPIIRLGLMATDEICEGGKSVVAGPCHSSFGELVRSEVIRPLLIPNLSSAGEAVVKIHPKELSIAIGNRGSNRQYLEQKWHRKVRFVPDENQERYLPF